MNVDWLQPGAFVALVAAAGPILVHLLRRHRAARVPFPTLQFVTATQAAAVRLKLPSDRWLMLLRVAIMAAAAAAWAQPVVMTSQRQGRLQQAVARAIVIDTSASMAPSSSRVREAADAQHRGVVVAFEIVASDLGEAVVEAVDRLREAHAGRREVVVISDFQHGAFSDHDAARVPDEIGLRVIPIASPAVATDSPPPFATFGVDEFPPLTGHLALHESQTQLTMRAAPAAAAATPRMIAPPHESLAIKRLFHIVARAGAPAASIDRPVAMIFDGVALPTVAPPRQPWMIRAIVAMRTDVELRRVAWEAPSEPGRRTLGSPWTVVATDRSSRTAVAVAAHDRELLAYVAASPSTLIAAVVLRSLLTAVSEPLNWREHEPQRESPAQLKKWTRTPADTPAVRGTVPPPGDARWMWGLALALIVAEHVFRRPRRQQQAAEPSVHAA